MLNDDLICFLTFSAQKVRVNPKRNPQQSQEENMDAELNWMTLTLAVAQTLSDISPRGLGTLSESGKQRVRVVTQHLSQLVAP